MKINFMILGLCFIASNIYAQEFALEQLQNSPRHHEWVKVSSKGRTIHSFVAYPETKENTLAAIVIHENRGLTDWVRSFTDQLAEAGYIAIAPDLLSGFDAEHSQTRDFKNSDKARGAIYELDPAQIIQDLQAVQEYISKVSASNGQIVVIGFCWGGSQTFRFATHSRTLSAALVFYGTSPTSEEEIREISAPVYGFYGENDQRINATIPDTQKLMMKYARIYDLEIYKGAGHAFLRNGDDPEGSPENKKARNESWARIKKILSNIQ